MGPLTEMSNELHTLPIRQEWGICNEYVCLKMALIIHNRVSTRQVLLELLRRLLTWRIVNAPHTTYVLLLQYSIAD